MSNQEAKADQGKKILNLKPLAKVMNQYVVIDE